MRDEAGRGRRGLVSPVTTALASPEAALMFPAASSAVTR